MSQKDAPQPSDRPTWSSLEIFLFSNGQRYSPPRKYNLRADEVTLWDTTLNFLARSQYGAKHLRSIQLYTIEGKKVEGPLELSHGNAYVAVVPPEPFVQTGYHAYMMKASRSWEKRQEKRKNENIQSKPDKSKVSNKSARPEEDNDATSIKIVQDILIVPTTITALPAAATVTSNSVRKVKQIPKSGPKSTPLKQNPKTIIPQQRLSILRNRNNKPEPLPLRKQTPLSHVGSAKKCATKNFEKEAMLIKTASLLLREVTKPNLEDSEKPERVSGSDNNKQQHSEPSSILSQAKSTSKSHLLQNTVNEGTDGKVDRDISSTLMHREDEYQSVYLNTDSNPTIHNIENKVPVLLNVVNGSTNNDACVNSDSKSTKIEMHSKFQSKANNISGKPMNSQGNSVVTGIQTAEKIHLFVSKGDTINLKLNIDVHNNGASSINNVKTCRQIIPHPVVDDSKTEYEREPPARPVVDNNPLADSVAPALTKSWQSITMCQCSYDSNPDQVLTVTATPVYVDNNNYFIVLPPEKGNKNFISYNCGHETLESEENNINPVNIGNEIKLSKNTSVTEERLVQKDFQLDCEKKCPRCVMVNNQPATSDNIQQPVPGETAGPPSPKDFIIDCEMKRCAMGIAQQETFGNIQQPARSETVVLPVQKNFLFNCKTECPECSLGKDQPVYVNKQRRYSTMFDCICGKCEVNKQRTIKTLIDNSSQTDWNNLLLEARLQKDGRYLLHLPPLEMLKLYNAV